SGAAVDPTELPVDAEHRHHPLRLEDPRLVVVLRPGHGVAVLAAREGGRPVGGVGVGVGDPGPGHYLGAGQGAPAVGQQVTPACEVAQGEVDLALDDRVSGGVDVDQCRLFGPQVPVEAVLV